MMKNNLKTFLFVATLLTLAACSKYDDGPALSLRSPEKRLSGLWECSSVRIGGIESQSYYMADSVYLRFSISGTRDELFISLVEESKESPALSSSVLTVDKKNATLTFELPEYALYRDLTDQLFELIPAIHVENTWDIKRLAVNELWISTTYNGVTFDLQLSKLEQYLLNK